jgi:3-methyladenine DNA glycosylase AlkD
VAGHDVPAGPVLADRIAAELAARADADRVDGMQRYMRDQFAFLGVTAPGQRAAWRAATVDVARRLPEPVVVEAVLDLWARPEREHQYLACTLANRHARPPARGPVPTPAFLDIVETLLTTRPWWDTVDALATHSVGDLVRAHPQLRERMDAWLLGDDMWLTRSALLHMSRWRTATDADWLFSACLAQGAHRDFFVRKAIGWALREYSKVDAAAVVAFVGDHRDDLSGLSRREALMWLERRRRRAAAQGG